MGVTINKKSTTTEPFNAFDAKQPTHSAKMMIEILQITQSTEPQTQDTDYVATTTESPH